MGSKSTERRHAKAYDLYRACRDWPLGSAVRVSRSNGETLDTVTESAVWHARGGAYVRVRGIPGNTRLSRVSLRVLKEGA